MRLKTTGIMAAAAGLLILSACSRGPGEPEVANAYKKSVEEPSPEAEKVADRDPQALKIGTIHDPETEAYCTFTQAGHTFVYDDPATWKFVFLSEDAGDPTPSGRVKINDEVVAFTRADETKDDQGIETWHYRSAERGILIEMKLRETASGAEYTNYTGTIAIIEPTKTEKMGIEGDCGV